MERAGVLPPPREETHTRGATSPPGTQGAWGRRVRAWLPAGTLLLLAALVFVVLPVPAPARLALGHLALIALPLLAGARFVLSGRRAPPGRRAAWMVLGAACGAVVAAQSIWAVRQVFFDLPEPFPSPSFVLFVCFHPLLAAAVLLALRPMRLREKAAATLLDALVLLLASYLLLLQLVIVPLRAASPFLARSELAWIMTAQLACLSSVFFSGLLVIWREPPVPSRTALGLAAGMLLNAAANLLLAKRFDPDPSRPGHGFTLIWMLVWLLVAWSASGEDRSRPARASRPGRERLTGGMRHGVVVAALLVLATTAADGLGEASRARETPFVVALLTAALVARWVVALRSAEREGRDRRALAHTRALVEVSNALAAVQDLDAALELVAVWSQRLLGARGAAIELAGPEGSSTVAAAAGVLAGTRGQKFKDGVVQRWVKERGSGGPQTLLQAAPPGEGRGEHVGPAAPIAIAPLRFRGHIFGGLFLLLERDLLDGPELELLGALAEQAAIALENDRLLGEARQRERQRFQSEKLSMVGQLAGGIAHEINNPLAAISSAAELLLDGAATSPDEPARLLGLVHAEAKRAGAIVRSLLALVQPQEGRVEAVDLSELLEEVIRLRSYAHGLQEVSVERELEPLPRVQGDPDRLRQVFLNLIVNAEQALAKQSIRRLAFRGSSDDAFVTLRVEDNGPGIPEEHLDKLFEPFFTTKPVGEGTGLGLSVSYGILRELGGSLQVENQPQGGAAFILRLPVATEPVAHSSSRQSVPRPALPEGVKATVLLVDDEPALREVAARALRRAGFTVELAGNGEAALELLQRERFDVILSDIRMPGLGGEGLYGRLEELHIPVLDRFIFISGDVAADRASGFLAATGRPYLLKPFELQHLVEAVHRVALRSA